jgi:ANTAR domain/GAF domain
VLDDIALPPVTRLATLARELSERSTEADARQLLVNEAVALCGCTAAAFAGNLPSGTLNLTWGGPAELVEQLARLLQPIGEAVAGTVLAGRQPVASRDLAVEDRWPRYTAALLQRSPIRSVQAHPVRLADSELAVLVLYAEDAGYFLADRSQLGALLADHAGIGLSLLQSRHKTEHLTIALQNSREIGQAMGILMASHKITADAAFDLLRNASQRGHLKLREVAKDVVLTGQLPALPPRPAKTDQPPATEGTMRTSAATGTGVSSPASRRASSPST